MKNFEEKWKSETMSLNKIIVGAGIIAMLGLAQGSLPGNGTMMINPSQDNAMQTEQQSLESLVESKRLYDIAWKDSLRDLQGWVGREMVFKGLSRFSFPEFFYLCFREAITDHKSDIIFLGKYPSSEKEFNVIDPLQKRGAAFVLPNEGLVVDILKTRVSNEKVYLLDGQVYPDGEKIGPEFYDTFIPRTIRFLGLNYQTDLVGPPPVKTRRIFFGEQHLIGRKDEKALMINRLNDLYGPDLGMTDQNEDIYMRALKIALQDYATGRLKKFEK